MMCRWILASVEVAETVSPVTGVCVADEVEDFWVKLRSSVAQFLEISENRRCLMGFDLEAMVDSENGNREPKAVTELALKFGFPDAGAATVVAAVSARMNTSGRAASVMSNK